MFAYTTTIHIHDTDAAGVVYFAHFLRLMHEAYEAWLAGQGVNLADLLTSGQVFIPIAHAEADYKTPLFCGETIRIEIRTDRVSRHAYGLTYQIFNTKNVLAAEGKTVHVAVDRATRTKVELPDQIRTALETL